MREIPCNMMRVNRRANVRGGFLYDICSKNSAVTKTNKGGEHLCQKKKENFWKSWI